MDGANSVNLDLEQNEADVMHAASRIFAAYVIAGKVTADNEQEMMDKCVALATQMAKKADVLINTGSEVRKGLNMDPNYKPLG